MLQQKVVKPTQSAYGTVVALHKFFYAKAELIVFVTEDFGEFALLVEEEPVFASTFEEMESVTNPPKEILPFVDKLLFHSAKKSKFYKVAK